MAFPVKVTNPPKGATHYMAESDHFKEHFAKIVGDNIQTCLHGKWTNYPLQSALKNYIPLNTFPLFNLVYIPTDVDTLFLGSGNDLMIEYSGAHQERDHNISMAFTHKEGGHFLAGVSANCGKDNNSRGTGFTVDFACIHIADKYQGKGLLDALLAHTIDNIMTYYPFENVPNETCVEFTIASEKGGYSAWKLFNLLKRKLAYKKTKVMLWESDSSTYISSIESLEEVIRNNRHC